MLDVERHMTICQGTERGSLCIVLSVMLLYNEKASIVQTTLDKIFIKK